MENQHRQINGYRELNADEISATNEVKSLGKEVGSLIEYFEKSAQSSYEADKRWLAIAKTDLQKGFMALVRSIAKPESF